MIYFSNSQMRTKNLFKRKFITKIFRILKLEIKFSNPFLSKVLESFILLI